MKLLSSLLLASTAVLATVGAQAADLPSKKAAPSSYVKICDAYGAGFFYIPGSDTCLKVGGYVRAEYQYTPAKRVVVLTSTGVTNPAQASSSMDTSGMEMRGRIELDARTATPWGAARTFVRLRLTNNTGIRVFTQANNGTYANSGTASAGSTLEAAMVQWAGFTFGVAPNNYAFMPSIFYHGNAWAGFPNGQKQIAYTATIGGGVSATVAIEDKTEWAYETKYNTTPANGYNITANVRYDQPWGFAILHATAGNASINANYATTGSAPGTLAGLGTGNTFSALAGAKSYSDWAVGATAMFNLPMLGAGDKLWITANYANGYLGALLSSGGLNNLSNSSGGRQLGGIGRVDLPITVTGGAGTSADPFTIGRTTGYNVAAAVVHNWTGLVRSQAKAGYVELSPATTTLANQWGKGRVWEVTHALIFSPAKDFDIGLELQYLNMKNNVQNANSAFVTAGSPGLNESGWSSKLRVERNF